MCFIHAIDVLEPHTQWLYQFDWSSGHTRSQDGGLKINSVRINYGGKGGKHTRDSEMTADCLGTEESCLHKQASMDGDMSCSLENPLSVEGTIIETFDCKLKVDDVQSMILDDKEKMSLTPFSDLTAPLEDMQLLDDKKELMITKAGKKKSNFICF